MKTIDEAIRHPSGRVSAMAGPAQIDTCREGFFKEALQEALKRGIPMQTHACQAVVEFHEMVRRHGKTPIEWLDSIGVLGPDLVIGHGIFLNDHPQIHYPHGNDFERLRESQVIADDVVEQRVLRKRGEQIREHAAGDHQQPQPSGARTFQRGDRRCIDASFARKRVVVVGGQRGILHIRRSYNTDRKRHDPGTNACWRCCPGRSPVI